MEKPKFTISKSITLEKYNKCTEISDLVSYSSKTNPVITKILEENTDSLFSVHFINELKHVKDKSRALFLVQGWNETEIKSLVKQGVKRFAVDNIADLDILENFLKSNSAKIDLLLRVKLKENSIKTEKYFVFGMSSEMVSRKVKELQDNKNIESLGIHFHRKTQNMAEWNLQYDIENMFGDDVLEAIDVMNIGGGLPSVYANTNTKVFDGIYNRILKFKEFLNAKKIKLMIEPGRYIAAPAGKLIAHITGMCDNNIIIDASVYNSDMDAILVPVKLLIEGEHEDDKSENSEAYVIKGCTPCSMDLFRYRVYLNPQKIGDKLVFLNAGAYGFSSDFCDLDTLETEIVE